MRLLLEINITPDRKHFFRAYDDLHEVNADIIGCGWTISDAIDDFIMQIQKDSFLDDDVMIPVDRGKIEIKSRKLMLIL